MIKLNIFFGILEFIKLLRIDIFFLFFHWTNALPSFAHSALIRDKYCINELGMKPELCLNLDQLKQNNFSTWTKIDDFDNLIETYRILIIIVPGIVFNLFMGYWIDFYPNHLRFLLTIPCVSSLLSFTGTIYFIFHFNTPTIYLLYPYALKDLLGGLANVLLGSYTYITRKTPAKYRSIRFALLQFFTIISCPIASILGTHILNMEPWFHGQFRNYLGVYLVSFGITLISMIWILLTLYDAGYPDLNDDELPINDSINKERIQNQKQHESDARLTELIGYHVGDDEKSKGLFTVFCKVFKPITLRRIVKTWSRKRGSNRRVILFHITISMVILLIRLTCESVDEFVQFVRKVYKWRSGDYTYLPTITMCSPSIVAIFLSPILTNQLRVHDTTLGAIGGVSYILSAVLRASFLEPWAYFASIALALPGGLGMVSVRSLVSRLVAYNEIGQIYALLCYLESASPKISNWLFATIFNSTRHVAPGLIYYILAILMLYPLLTSIWLDLTRNYWDPDVGKVSHKPLKHEIVETANNPLFCEVKSNSNMD